jgi:hypothetical protein
MHTHTHGAWHATTRVAHTRRKLQGRRWGQGAVPGFALRTGTAIPARRQSSPSIAAHACARFCATLPRLSSSPLSIPNGRPSVGKPRSCNLGASPCSPDADYCARWGGGSLAGRTRFGGELHLPARPVPAGSMAERAKRPRPPTAPPPPQPFPVHGQGNFEMSPDRAHRNTLQLSLRWPRRAPTQPAGRPMAGIPATTGGGMAGAPGMAPGVVRE